MKTLYGVGAETFDEILKTNRSFESLQDIETSTDLNADDPEASVVKFVNQIIREAIHERATDIHVEPLENDLRIRYRIDGILHEVAVPPQLRLLQSAIISRLKVMAHMDIAERRLPQDGRINLQAADQNNRRPCFHHPDGERRIDQFSSARPRQQNSFRLRATRSEPGSDPDDEVAPGPA